MSSSTTNYINALTNEITDFLQPMVDSLSMKTADVALLKTFFKNWQDAIDTDHDGNLDDGKTSKQGYDYAIAQLPKDKPGTTYNEEITEDQLLDKLKKEIPDESIKEINDTNVMAHLDKDLNAIQIKVRQYLVLGEMYRGDIDDNTKKIDQLNRQSGDPLYGEATASMQQDDGGFGGGGDYMNT